MLRADYRESISQAVSGIRDTPSLEGRSKAAIAQGVVLRLLAAAGWDVFDLSQVMPGYITGNRSIDFALMPPGQPKGAVPPRVFINVRTPTDNIESPRMERQLLALCAREEVSLAALTNGLRWLLFLWSPEGGRMESRFCEIDLRGDPEAAAADINRYLTKDRVSNGQAARSAERELRDSNREVVDRRAVIQGWRQVVGGLDEGLIELVATAAEQRAGHRPDNRLVRRVLAENRAALLAPGTEASAGSGPGGGLRSTPSSFTLDSETKIEHADLDQESPGTGRQRAGAHSLRHSAARHWLTTAGIPLNVVSQWLGHATPEVTLRIYLPIVGSTHSMADVP